MFGTIPTVFAEEYICVYFSPTVMCNSVETITDDELAILIFIDEFIEQSFTW